MGGSESPIQVCVPGWRSSSGVSRYMKTNDAAGRLHVEVGDLQRIVIDKRAPRFHHIAHQRRKNLVCRDGILDSDRSEEHTSELQSLMRNSYAVFCLKKKNKQ